jgi:hypothetical protein
MEVTVYSCEYCGKSFKKSQTILTHKCEKRDRHDSKNETYSRIAFHAFNSMYPKQKSFNEFASSAYYKAFTKFGKYCIEVKVISPEEYSLWLIKNKKRIDDWTRDSLYSEYLIDFLPREDVGQALTRAITNSIKWSEKINAPSKDWLRYGNLNTISYSIVTGRLSGWALYNSNSGQDLLERMSGTPALLKECWPYIDSDIWKNTFQHKKTDTSYAWDILGKAGW